MLPVLGRFILAIGLVLALGAPVRAFESAADYAFVMDASSSKYISCRRPGLARRILVLALPSTPGPRIISIILKGRSLPINLWGSSGKGVPLEGLIRATF